MPRRRIIRYRRPSLKTALVGITAVKRPFRAPGNFKRRVLHRSGYYSEPMKAMRFLRRLFK